MITALEIIGGMFVLLVTGCVFSCFVLSSRISRDEEDVDLANWLKEAEAARANEDNMGQVA